MKNYNNEDIDYFKDILLDYIENEAPRSVISDAKIIELSQNAAQEFDRDDLTTSQAIESAFKKLFSFHNEFIPLLQPKRNLPGTLVN